MLDTRDYLSTHARKPALERDAPKPSKFSARAVKVRDAQKAKLSKAYAANGKHSRADAVAICGQSAVAYHPHTHKLLRSPVTGVPCNITFKCGARCCADCEGDLARRGHRNIMERLSELHERGTRSGPIYRHKPRIARAPSRTKAFRAWGFRHASRSSILAVDAAALGLRRLAPPFLGRVQLHRAMMALGRATTTPGKSVALLEAMLEAESLSVALGERFKAASVKDGTKLRLVVGRTQRRPSFSFDVELQEEKRRVPAPSFVNAHSRSLCWRSEQRRSSCTADLVFGVRTERRRQRAEHFRIGPPPTRNGYGCRLITLTQPARAGEPLSEALDRLEDALARLTSSPVWSAHVDGAVIKLEYERSTPGKRAAEGGDDGIDDGRGSWWHAHAHVLVWGRPWPQRPACGPEDCGRCARCTGSDPEDSLLMVWRRALVESRHYGLAEVRARLRWFSHRSRRCWARALDDVKIGGARIEAPRRSRNGQPISPASALREVVKYTTKPVRLLHLGDDDLAEMLRAIDRRRLTRCTGLLFGVHVPDASDTDENGHDQSEGMEPDGDGRIVGVDDEGNRVDSAAWVWRFDDVSQEDCRAAREQVDNAHKQRRTDEWAAREKGRP